MADAERRLRKYAEIIARLSRPLADRAGVLWLANLDEIMFAELEARCLADMEASDAAAKTYGRLYAQWRRELAVDEPKRPVPPAAAEPAHDGGLSGTLVTLASATEASGPPPSK